MKHSSEQTYLSVDQVAERFDVSSDSIWRWKRNDSLAWAVKLGGRTTRWRLSDIETWEASRQTCFAFHLDLTGSAFADN